MKILFLGYTISKEATLNLNGVSYAGNNMQLNVLKNLVNETGMDICSITIYPIAAFPKSKKIIIRKENIQLFNNFYSVKIGFINLPILKQILETIMVFLEARKQIKKNNIKTVFTFNMFPQVGLPAKWVKKLYACEIVSLVADLPIDDSVGRKGLSKVLRDIFDYLTKSAILECDKIIALNINAINKYAPKTPFIIVDGGVESSDITPLKRKRNKEKNIVYTGALVEYSGILNLIEAMKLIKDEKVVLDIYGSGQIEETIKRETKIMDNVRYHGRVDNLQVKKIQREAFLLVNPRPVDDPISKVTFPSKIFEYMLSGTPVLTTRLNGFSEGYLDKMFFVDNNNPELLATEINKIISLSEKERSSIALKARTYVINNKTWAKQCEKMKEFILDQKNE